MLSHYTKGTGLSIMLTV